MKRRGRLQTALSVTALLWGTCGIALTPGEASPVVWDASAPAAETSEAFLWPGVLPERWYAGEHGRKPVTREQGDYGTCWALAAASALEAALLPGQHTVFSADHMALRNAYTVPLDEGGDYRMAMAYLSGWQGPVTEAEDPYGDAYSPPGLQAAVHVQEIRLLEDAPPERIKQAVMECGAVQTSLYMKKSELDDASGWYNARTCAYYVPEEKTANHDVIILGWDDHFSRFLFSQVPDRDGAFLCQNSWTDRFGRDGVFCVSYADANIAKQALAYSRVEPADNFERIYQTDDCGWVGRQGYDSETCWLANVYTAQSDEALAAVGFYATGPDTSYEIYIVPEFAGTASFAERRLLQRGAVRDAGYYTVELDEVQELRAGTRFAVAVRITTPDEMSPAAVEFRADGYTQNVVTEGKEGYLSQNGEFWQNTEECYGTNVCLKVYTISKDMIYLR